MTAHLNIKSEISLKNFLTEESFATFRRIPRNIKPKLITNLRAKQKMKKFFSAPDVLNRANLASFGKIESGHSRKAEFSEIQPKILEDEEEYDQCRYKFCKGKNIWEKNCGEKIVREKMDKVVGSGKRTIGCDYGQRRCLNQRSMKKKKLKTTIYKKPKYLEKAEIEGEDFEVSEADKQSWQDQGTLSDLLEYDGDISALVECSNQEAVE
jgi:hypothetical protein